MAFTSKQPEFLEHAGDSTRILSKKRQLFDMKEKYAAEKAKYDEKIKQLEMQEADLKKRDLDFQAKVIFLPDLFILWISAHYSYVFLTLLGCI